MVSENDPKFLCHLRRFPVDRPTFLRAVASWITTKLYLIRGEARRQRVSVSGYLCSQARDEP